MKKIIKGEIHLIPFPFTDLSKNKLRPCVVLGADLEDIVVVFMTSAKPKTREYVLVHPSKGNGIKSISYIRYTKIATLDKKLSLGKIGVLEKELYQNVTKELKLFLGGL